MADCSNVTSQFVTLPYSVSYSIPNTNPLITIEQCEKGFVVFKDGTKYACESLHSAYEVIKKLFKAVPNG